MAASPLSVELDTPEVELGDVVRGRVRVLEELARSTRLDVALERGGKRVGDVKVATVTVATGPLAAGASYPFELAVPLDAPFTFDGHAHSNAYRVLARADVAWAIDPKVVAGVGVWPRRVAPSPEAIAAAVAAVPRVVKRTPLGCQILIWAFLGPLVAMLAVGLAPFVMWLLAKRYILRTRVGGFGVEVPARPAAFGEWVPVTVRFRLKRSLHVARLGLLFRGTEQWTTGSGKSSQTHYHHFHEQKVTALENVWLAPAPGGYAQRGGGGAYRDAPRVAGGEPALEWRTHVLMPPTGRPTIDRSVYYTVEAKLEVRGWPDGKEQKSLPTVGVRVAGTLPHPEILPVEETSGGILFLPPDAPAPPGVDLSSAQAGIWAWLVIVFAGFAATAAGVILYADRARSTHLAILVAGAAALALGLGGMLWKLFR